MENEYIKKEKSFLRVTYHIHIIVCALLSMIYFIVYENIYWLSNSIFYMFGTSLFIFLFLSLFLLIIYILFLVLKLTQKLLNFFIIISIVLFFIVSVNSLFCSIISCYNSALFDTFYNDCPFNYNLGNMDKMKVEFVKNNKIMKNICKNRKCFIINNISNIYLCNFYEKEIYYDSFQETNINQTYNEIEYFITNCKEHTHFYLNKKEKYQKYNIDYNFDCPSKSSIIYNYALTYLFIFANIFCSSVLWLFEFCSYKTILLLLTELRTNDMGLKETNNTSKMENDNNNNNANNHENISQFNGTEIIIVQNSNKNKNDNSEDNKNINQENSKSENILINNANNNIFRIINQKEQIKNEHKK